MFVDVPTVNEVDDLTTSTLEVTASVDNPNTNTDQDDSSDPLIGQLQEGLDDVGDSRNNETGVYNVYFIKYLSLG